MDRSEQSHVPATSTPRKEPPVPFKQEASWVPEPKSIVSEKKYFFFRFPIPKRPTCSLITILTALSSSFFYPFMCIIFYLKAFLVSSCLKLPSSFLFVFNLFCLNFRSFYIHTCFVTCLFILVVS